MANARTLPVYFAKSHYSIDILHFLAQLSSKHLLDSLKTGLTDGIEHALLWLLICLCVLDLKHSFDATSFPQESPVTKQQQLSEDRIPSPVVRNWQKLALRSGEMFSNAYKHLQTSTQPTSSMDSSVRKCDDLIAEQLRVASHQAFKRSDRAIMEGNILGAAMGLRYILNALQTPLQTAERFSSRLRSDMNIISWIRCVSCPSSNFAKIYSYDIRPWLPAEDFLEQKNQPRAIHLLYPTMFMLVTSPLALLEPVARVSYNKGKNSVGPVPYIEVRSKNIFQYAVK